MAENATYAALDQYIQRLIRESSPDHTIWNVEKLRRGESTNWNYIDGCMMTALLSLHQITGEQKYFDFGRLTRSRCSTRTVWASSSSML